MCRDESVCLATPSRAMKVAVRTGRVTRDALLVGGLGAHRHRRRARDVVHRDPHDQLGELGVALVRRDSHVRVRRAWRDGNARVRHGRARGTFAGGRHAITSSAKPRARIGASVASIIVACRTSERMGIVASVKKLFLLRVVVIAPIVAVACRTQPAGSVARPADSTAALDAAAPTPAPLTATPLSTPTDPPRTANSPRPAGGRCASAPAGVTDPKLHYDECHTDKDCKDGSQGRCVAISQVRRPASNRCTYEECTRDSDCAAAGGVCLCGTSAVARSFCRAGDCRDASDCHGLQCHEVPPEVTGSFGVQAQYCQTPKDTCHSAADCAADKTCGYAPGKHVWECVPKLARPVG